jgi:hypothetical protein
MVISKNLFMIKYISDLLCFFGPINYTPVKGSGPEKDQHKVRDCMDKLVNAIEDEENGEFKTCLLSYESDIFCSLQSNVPFSNSQKALKKLRVLTDQLVKEFLNLRGKHSWVGKSYGGEYYRLVYQYE